MYLTHWLLQLKESIEKLLLVYISLLLRSNSENLKGKSDPSTTRGLFVPDQISELNSLSQKEARSVTQCHFL